MYFLLLFITPTLILIRNPINSNPMTLNPNVNHEEEQMSAEVNSAGADVRAGESGEGECPVRCR